MSARRYDGGKLRYNLVPTYAFAKVVEVYTKGAEKYSLFKDKDGNILKRSEITDDLTNYTVHDDGADNWRNGLSWSKTIAAAERHITEWKNGIDIDPDLGTKHLANAVWNLLSLMEYEKIHPELDDRLKYYAPRIALDIDTVLNTFEEHFLEYLDLDRTPPVHWNDPRFRNIENWTKVNTPDFWENIPVRLDASLLPFEPVAYVTARSINAEWTMNWLVKNNFPIAPVHHVPKDSSKLEVLKSINCDMFIDDKYETFVELNNNGIYTKLFTASNNLKYNVPSHMRINSLLDLR